MYERHDGYPSPPVIVFTFTILFTSSMLG